MSIFDWFRVDTKRYEESTLDLLKRKAVESGLDPAFFDMIANQPCCPGSLGPDDPGRIGGCEHRRPGDERIPESEEPR